MCFLKYFKVSLDDYWDEISGFKLSEFDETVPGRHGGDREMFESRVEREYGEEAMSLITELVKT